MRAIRTTRRTAAAPSGVRFCDRCASISTAGQRAAAHRDRTRDAVLRHGPRA